MAVNDLQAHSDNLHTTRYRLSRSTSAPRKHAQITRFPASKLRLKSPCSSFLKSLQYRLYQWGPSIFHFLSSESTIWNSEVNFFSYDILAAILSDFCFITTFMLLRLYGIVYCDTGSSRGHRWSFAVVAVSWTRESSNFFPTSHI